MGKPQLLDVVRIKRDWPAHGVRAGQIGAIVEVYDVPDEAYEVEFVNEEGVATAMFAPTPDEFEVVWRAPIREQAAT